MKSKWKDTVRDTLPLTSASVELRTRQVCVCVTESRKERRRRRKGEHTELLHA